MGRRSPFRPFSEYRTSTAPSPLLSPTSSTLIPTLIQSAASLSNNALATKHLVYTYTLAFQCVVNIGVRGSELIRTRVVEAGVLEVIVHILREVLEEMKMRKEIALAVANSNASAGGLGKRASISSVLSTTGTVRQGRNSIVLASTSTSTTPIVELVALSTSSSSSLLTTVNATNVNASNDDDAASASGASSGVDGEGDATEAEAEIEIEIEIDVDESASIASSSASTSMTGRRRTRASAASDQKEVEHGAASSGGSVSGEERDVDGDISMDVDTVEEVEQHQSMAIITTAMPSSISSLTSPPLVSRPSPILPSAPAAPSHQQQQHFSHPQTQPKQRIEFRDEDVLLSLQLLAYLSKYPHVRAIFHSPKDFQQAPTPPTSPLATKMGHHHVHGEGDEAHAECGKECAVETSPRTLHSFPQTWTTTTSTATPRSVTGAFSSSKSAKGKMVAPSSAEPSLNIFSLVEAFTYRPAASDRHTPRHSNEVQYWAGVIMRNACRKDDSRGGIRQCANMLCGGWETFPREFAKCRRCRKAKYCSKSCQSSGWQAGHRYWCCRHVATAPAGGTGTNTGEEEEEDGVVTPARATTANDGGAAIAAPAGEEEEMDVDPVVYSIGLNEIIMVAGQNPTVPLRRPHPHRSHLHASHSRPSTASSMDDDDDDLLVDDAPPSASTSTATTATPAQQQPPRRLSGAAAVPRRLVRRTSQPSLNSRGMPGIEILPRGLATTMRRVEADVAAGGVVGGAGGGGGPGEEDMDEDEVAREMMIEEPGTMRIVDVGAEGPIRAADNTTEARAARLEEMRLYLG